LPKRPCFDTRVMNITPPSIHWWNRYHAFYAAGDFAEPVRDRLSIEWQSLENSASLSRVPSVIIIFHHPSWKLRCWNGFQLRSSFITAVMDWSRGNSQTHLRCLTGAFGVHAYKPADWDNLVNNGKGSNKKIISNCPYHYFYSVKISDVLGWLRENSETGLYTSLLYIPRC